MAFTEEQIKAIESEGRTIVSASAGSGKTTVMIEKIIRLIKEGADVEEILAVTFTKKAASQMKEKLSKALIEAINAPETTPEKRAELKKQLSAVPGADISTIHSFCAKLIRRHFYAAGVDNGFRVIGGDDAEGAALKGEALDELFEEAYEEKDPRFAHLLSVYWRKKSDNNLRKIFKTVYDGLRDRADYREYLNRSGAYDENTFDSICSDLYTILQEKCRYYYDKVEEELHYFEEINAKPQTALATELMELLTSVIEQPDYFSACHSWKKNRFTPNRSSKSDGPERAQHIERLAFLKTRIVAIFEKELTVVGTREEELDAFLRSGETAAALAFYLLRFDEKYEQLKSERGVLDYNDLEHKALALLKNEEIAAETREKYRYVFVDEYQDVNPVQEEIITRLSCENLFLVGDVKQSIYGFRGSKSKFFVEKQREFAAGGGSNLAMTRNFRSSDAVLDAVNSQFSLAMTLQTSNVDYAADSYMERGGRYALKDGRVQIHFLGKAERTGKNFDGVYSVKANAGKKEQTEGLAAKMIRSIIEQELRSRFYDPDTGEYREVKYSDIAILSRKKQGQIGKTVAELSDEGLPVTAAVAVNVCEYGEVKTLIDVLSLLDNAEQDAPLCSALLSTMGNLTADDLATVRLAYKDEYFFRNACKKYVSEKEDLVAHKLKKFYAYFEGMRKLSSVLDAGELLTRILSETRMEARLLARPNGVASLKRIHRFIEEAVTPEPLSVHAFLDRLRNLDYKIEYSENGGEDSVKVLTMHSSKGLEYPIVILDNLSAQFRGVGHDDVFVEEKYGLAPRAFDTEKMTYSATLLRRLHERREIESSIADELNLYYVALTRAKYGLHMIFENRTSMADARYANSFADFTDFSVWDKYVVSDAFFDVPKQERTALVFRPDPALTKDIMNTFLWEYPFTGYENFPVKSSATALLAEGVAEIEALLDDGADDVDEAFETENDWSFASISEATSKETGIAYHSFLENFDFSCLYDAEGNTVDETALREIVSERYKRMQDAGEDVSQLSVDKLKEILSNPVFSELYGARLYKEQQFLVSLPVKDTYALKKGVAAELRARADGEEMLFQGAIDLLAIGEDGEIRIIDYKYSRRSAAGLRAHYKPQLDLYKRATAKIMDAPLDKVHCSIVNICLGFQVDMD